MKRPRLRSGSRRSCRSTGLAAALEPALAHGLEPVRRLRWPVVSIGNLSTGGSGKTPLTIALAQALVQRGLRVDVLSRGYGRRSALPLPRRAQTARRRVWRRATADCARDSVPVYVADERYQAGLLAENSEQLTCRDCIFSTMGFSIASSIATWIFCCSNRQDWKDSLLPAGNLREPLRAAYRAGVIAIPAEDGELEGGAEDVGLAGKHLARATAHGGSGSRWAGGRVLRHRAAGAVF
jgi:tetraacyldisaccharide 4'-kinase